MRKCSVVLVYEGYQKPVHLGMTDAPRLLVLVKRQLIQEATEALRGAEVIGDAVLINRFGYDLQELQTTLDLIIPAEFEEVMLSISEQP